MNELNEFPFVLSLLPTVLSPDYIIFKFLLWYCLACGNNYKQTNLRMILHHITTLHNIKNNNLLDIHTTINVKDEQEPNGWKSNTKHSNYYNQKPVMLFNCFTMTDFAWSSAVCRWKVNNKINCTTEFNKTPRLG